jgi:hypothetical protein
LGLIDGVALRYLFSLALTLFLFCSVTSQGAAGVMQSMHHSDGFLDFASGMVQAEVPDKYPLELRSTPGVDIVIGHARKDQSGAILVSGLARRRFGSDCGPNMKVEVVVRGPDRRVLEEASAPCYLYSPGHGLAAQCHFAVFLKATPPPGSAVEIFCEPG